MSDPSSPPQPGGAASPEAPGHGSSAPEPQDAEPSPPRPQFGEYATPEEQRARIREPAPWQLEQTPVAPVMTDAPGPALPAPPAPAQRRVRPVDRIVTFALLAYGLVNVVSSVPAFLDYGAYAETMLAVMGVDAQISDPAAGRPWAIASVLVLTIGWCATVAVSWWSVRRGRLTWWIALSAGILFTFVSGVLMAVPLMSDPTVWQALVESVGG